MAPNSIVGKFVNDNNEEYLSTRVAQNLATFSRGLAKKIVSSGNAEDAAEALFTVTRSEIEVRKLADDIAACDVTFAHRAASCTRRVHFSIAHSRNCGILGFCSLCI